MINKVYIEYLLLKDDQQSFEQVLSIIQPKLLAFACSILKNQSSAQDALQDSLIAIVKGVKKLKDHRKFHAWIYQVTRNKCFDMIRKNQKHNNDSDIDSIPEPSIEDSDRDTKLDMMSMINQLPHKQKNIIHLFYYAGFNVIEIALIVNKPAGTVKSILYDARQTLKQLLGDQI